MSVDKSRDRLMLMASGLSFERRSTMNELIVAFAGDDALESGYRINLQVLYCKAKKTQLIILSYMRRFVSEASGGR